MKKMLIICLVLLHVFMSGYEMEMGVFYYWLFCGCQSRLKASQCGTVNTVVNRGTPKHGYTSASTSEKWVTRVDNISGPSNAFVFPSYYGQERLDFKPS